MRSRIVDKVEVFGLEDSIRAAKFPMSVDVETLDGKMTDGIRKLAKCAIGEGHDNWLNGVVVQFDLTFTVKAWVEAERYHFLDFVSSQSTMHRITKLDPAKQCCGYVDARAVKLLKEKIEEYNAAPTPENYLYVLYNTPVGFRLTARMTTNYRQLKTIYCQRRNHRLPEWREFCEWIKTLPESGLITGGDA